MCKLTQTKDTIFVVNVANVGKNKKFNSNVTISAFNKILNNKTNKLLAKM